MDQWNDNYFNNSKLITEQFGKWPSFHDAEVLRFELSRSLEKGRDPRAWLRMDLHVFTLSAELNEHGNYRTEKDFLITLTFTKIENLKIEDFNYQNVIHDLVCSKNVDGKLEIRIYPLFGLFGEFSCEKAEVTDIRAWNLALNQ
jgi:hypothetical protein